MPTQPRADTRLVLLPGLACDARLWAGQIDALPAALRPLVATVHARFDTIEAMAAGLLHEVRGDLVLCGASLGAMVAMEVARQAPGRIKGLALLGSNARPESPDMRQLREDAIALFERGELRDVLEPNIAFAFHPAQAADPALCEAYLTMLLDAGATQLIRQNRALMNRPDARRHLLRLRCPVLLMCGDGDRLTPPECTREIAALLPKALDVQLHWLDRCGHMLTMEKPQQVSKKLAEWLTAQRLDAA